MFFSTNAVQSIIDELGYNLETYAEEIIKLREANEELSEDLANKQDEVDNLQEQVDKLNE